MDCAAQHKELCVSIRAVLMTAKEPLEEHKLCSAYRELTYKDIPFREMGFSTLQDFLFSIHDYVDYYYERQKLFFIPVVNSEVMHLDKLLKAVKLKKNKSKKKSNGCSKKTPSGMLPAYVLRNIDEILCEHHSLTKEKFLNTYQIKYGYDINYASFNFDSLRTLLLSIPEICTLKYEPEVDFRVFSTTRCTVSHKPTSFSNRLVSLKQNIEKLVNLKGKVNITRILDEYECLFNERLDLHFFGFHSVMDMISQFGDVVSLKKSNFGFNIFPAYINEVESDSINQQLFNENEALVFEIVQYVRKSYDSELINYVYMLHIESPDDCCVIPIDRYEFLLDLMHDMDKLYLKSSDEVLDKLRIPDYMQDTFFSSGQPCAALYKEDSAFYRAIILENKSATEVKVLFVDYGNTAIVSRRDVLALQRDLFTVPIFAVQVAFANLVANSPEMSWSKTATEYIKHLAIKPDGSGKELYCHVISTKKTHLEVSLIDISTDDDIIICDVLVELGVAKVLTASSTNMSIDFFPPPKLLTQLENVIFSYKLNAENHPQKSFYKAVDTSKVIVADYEEEDDIGDFSIYNSFENIENTTIRHISKVQLSSGRCVHLILVSSVIYIACTELAALTKCDLRAISSSTEAVCFEKLDYPQLYKELESNNLLFCGKMFLYQYQCAYLLLVKHSFLTKQDFQSIANHCISFELAV